MANHSDNDDEIEVIQIDSSSDESDQDKYIFYTPIPYYSEEEVQAVAARLDSDEPFKEAAKNLIAWLEGGVCNMRNSARFYFLIQRCWNRVERLRAEEKEYQEEIKRLKKSVLSRSSCIQRELFEIEEIFSIIEIRNLGIYFTRNHLDKILEMRADLLNLKQIILADCVGGELQKESDVENIDDGQAESSVLEMQTKLDRTSELDFVYENCISSDLPKESDVENIDDVQAESYVHQMLATLDSLSPELGIVYENCISSDLPKESDVENMDFEQTESNVHKMQAKVDSLTSELDFVYENCVSSDLPKESDAENIDDEQAESNVHKMQAKLDSLTSESNIVYEKTEERQLTYEESKMKLKIFRPKEAKKCGKSIGFVQKKNYLMLKKTDNSYLLVEIAPQSDLDPNIMEVVSLISIFLCEYPNGATLKSIYSYLKERIPDSDGNFTKENIENLMSSHPNIFKQTGLILPEVVRKWYCVSITPETLTIVQNKKKLSNEKLSNEKVSGKKMSNKTLPGKKVPNKTLPGKTVPNKALPGKKVSNKTLPDKK